jgi:hypothetical protein
MADAPLLVGYRTVPVHQPQQFSSNQISKTNFSLLDLYMPFKKAGSSQIKMK